MVFLVPPRSPLYAAIIKLEWFTSINGPKFYNQPVNRNKVTLVKEEWKIPDELPFGHEKVVPLMAGESIHWKLKR